MAREVYTDKRFIEFSRKFVFMRVLADKDPEGAELANRYRVSGMPTFLILDSKGREIDRILGFRSAEEFMEILDLFLKYASEITSIR